MNKNIEIKNLDGKVIHVVQSDTLREANLRWADLSGANFRGANLYEANFFRANLYGANLYGANLYGADLYGADLRGADLRGADLRGADLSRADLSRADLCGADLCGADLSRANLSVANLRGADLYGADLRGADLRGADIANVKRLFVIPAGDLIGWKKLANGTIAKLRIPSAARRFGGVISNKCRAEFAEVLEGSGLSSFSSEFRYAPGKRVQPDTSFDENPFAECSSGIHFFLTKEEAEDYKF